MLLFSVRIIPSTSLLLLPSHFHLSCSLLSGIQESILVASASHHLHCFYALQYAQQTGLLDERCQYLNCERERERMTTAMEAPETRIESFQESENLLRAPKDSPPMIKGGKGGWHIWADCVRVWAASLTDNGLEIFQDSEKMGSEHDLESLELQRPETKDLKS